MMPTYQYECAACGHEFERFESITAKPDSLCPKCKKKKAKRNISGGAGFIFRGSGFYVTDYRSSAYKTSAKGDKTAGAEAGSASDSETARSETVVADA